MVNIFLKDDLQDTSYDADMFVKEACELRISTFSLDNFANEWQEMVRVRDAHAIEMDELRTANRILKTQV